MSIQRARAALPVLFGGGASSSLLTDLQIYYPLTEASGTRADSVGSATLTDSGSVGSGDGPGGDLGTAAQFDGTNELTSTDAVHQVGDADFTVALWVYLPSATDNMWLSGKTGGTQNEYVIRNLSSGPLFYLYAGGAPVSVQSTATVFSSATWAAMRGGFDAGSNEIFVQVADGAIVTASFTGTPNTSNSPLWVGGSNAFGNAVNGVRLAGYAKWARLLTDDEWDAFRATPPVGYPF